MDSDVWECILMIKLIHKCGDIHRKDLILNILAYDIPDLTLARSKVSSKNFNLLIEMHNKLIKILFYTITAFPKYEVRMQAMGKLTNY